MSLSETQPTTQAQWTAIARRRWDVRIERRPLAVLICGATALVVAATLSAVRTPVPRVHDEFSYLLAADTLVEGRVTNPTHRHWQHFESFHIIHQPSYASKYQPGQGAILALGTLVGGHPIVGVWLASALGAAAICWMLQGWVPNRWALVGGLLVALHALIHARWSLSYWGGSLPMAGGALMFGALPRIKRDARVGDSLLLAAGALLLVATRPFEGFVVGVCVSVALASWLIGHRCPSLHTAFVRVIAPSTALLIAGLAVLAYYNQQITGDPLQMPYQIHEATYGYSPLLLWQDQPPMPEYRHVAMHEFHTGWAVEDYERQQTLTGWVATKGVGFLRMGQLFLIGALFVPMLALPQIARCKPLRFVLITLTTFLAAQLMVPWTQAHYFAPAAPLVFLLVVQGLRYFNALPRAGHAWGRLVTPAVVALHIVLLLWFFIQYVNEQPDGWQWQRARLVAQLESTTGQHLVFVHYTSDHRGRAEWVYNRADIDGAKIVWAREMGPKEDQRLVDYFAERNVWRVEADVEKPQLVAVP